MRSYLFLGLALSLSAAMVSAESKTPAEEPTPVVSAVIERPAVLERSQQMAQALRERLPDQAKSLRTPTEHFLALWQDAHSAAPHGLVILLPGADQHADQPGMIQPLRAQLPRYGWQTLSLTLPDPFNPTPLRQPVPVVVSTDPQAAPEQSIASPAQQEEQAQAPVEQLHAQAQDDTEQAPHAPDLPETDPEADYLERVFDRIDAALAFAKTTHPKELIILGQGSGAYWSARYMHSRQPKDVSRLIWLQADTPAGMSQPLDRLLSTLKLPLADFATHPEHTAARKAVAARIGFSSYRALSLPVHAQASEQQEQIVRRVRGYLSPMR